MSLRQELRQVRLSLARAEGIAAYRTFPDTVLDDIVQFKPTTTERRLSIRGIGPQKASSYGPYILQAVRTHQGIQLARPDYYAPITPFILSQPKAPTTARPQLKEEICKLRIELAQFEGVPAFCVFDNNTLEDLLRITPRTPEQLVKVPGIKSVKMAKYGAKLLQAVNACFGERRGIDHFKRVVDQFLQQLQAAVAPPKRPPPPSPTSERARKRPCPSDPRPCPVCLENRRRDVALVPCGHCLCRTCAPRLNACPLCRSAVQSRLRLFD